MIELKTYRLGQFYHLFYGLVAFAIGGLIMLKKKCS